MKVKVEGAEFNLNKYQSDEVPTKKDYDEILPGDYVEYKLDRKEKANKQVPHPINSGEVLYAISYPKEDEKEKDQVMMPKADETKQGDYLVIDNGYDGKKEVPLKNVKSVFESTDFDDFDDFDEDEDLIPISGGVYFNKKTGNYEAPGRGEVYSTDSEAIDYLEDDDDDDDLFGESLEEGAFPTQDEFENSKYEVNSYFDEKHTGLSDILYTSDWSEVEDWTHEHCMKGEYIEIIDRDTGACKELDPDDYAEDFEGEFPFKPEDLDESIDLIEEASSSEPDDIVAKLRALSDEQLKELWDKMPKTDEIEDVDYDVETHEDYDDDYRGRYAYTTIDISCDSESIAESRIREDEDYFGIDRDELVSYWSEYLDSLMDDIAYDFPTSEYKYYPETRWEPAEDNFWDLYDKVCIKNDTFENFKKYVRA